MYTNLEKRAVWVIGALAIIAFWAIVIALCVVVFD